MRSALGRIGARRSRWFRRVAGVAVAALVVAAVAAIGLRSQERPARAATSPSPSPSELIQIHSVHGTSFVSAISGRRPLFILALGSDARPGEDISRQRSDSIHLIGVNFRLHRASILGFPRDSWVPIPGQGTNKINTAMVFGGPQLMVKTIENLTGIRIDFWVLTSFQGLINMVNGIGGLTIDVTQPMHDYLSGSNFEPGVVHVMGKGALAFARDRHSFIDGDLTRSANQGSLFRSALDKLHTTFPHDPAELFTWISMGWRNVHTDLSFATLFRLALTATTIPVSAVNNQVVPGTGGFEGAASVVFIQPGAQAMYRDMRPDGLIGR